MAESKMPIITFLEHYEQFPVLWDKFNPDYKNKQMRTIAYNLLLELTGLENPTELRKKIRSIRGTYNNELRKIRLSKKRGGLYKPKLSWYNYADTFLSTVFSEKQDNRNESPSDIDIHELELTQPPEKHATCSEPDDDWENEINDIEPLQNSRVTAPANGWKKDVNSPSKSCRMLNVKSTRRIQKVARVLNDHQYPKVKHQEDILLSDSHSDLKNNGLNESVTSKRDEFDLFGEFVATEMRQLRNDDNRRKLKRKIQRIVLEVAEEDDELHNSKNQSSKQFPIRICGTSKIEHLAELNNTRADPEFL